MMSAEPESNAATKSSTFRRGLPQFLAVGVKNMLLFGNGMTLGFPTILIPAIMGGSGQGAQNSDGFHLTAEQISWISSINLLCVPIGCMFSGLVTEPLGRRRAMQMINIPMIISWLLLYSSTNTFHLYAGLCVSGLSGGLMEAPVLTYVAEVTEPTFRGMLAASGTACVISGIFVQFVLGTVMHWRNIAAVSSALPVITIIALFFVPESPYWLLSRKREEKAQKSLSWLRGWVSFDQVEKEFNEIRGVLARKVARDKKANHAVQCGQKIKPYFQKSFLKPFALCAAVFAIGHFSGKTPLQTYAVQIFSTLKAPIDKYKATVILGATELIGTIICILLVHVTKKRPLVFVSLIGCGTCFLATATYARYMDLIPGVTVDNVVANVSGLNFQANEIITNNNFNANNTLSGNATQLIDFTTIIPDSIDFGNESTTFTLNDSKSDSFQSLADEILLKVPHAKENELYWIPLILLITGALFSHIGIRIIPWMLIGEVFPANVRSGASGLASAIGYLFGFLSNKFYLGMVATMTLPGTFWFYSGVALVGVVILYFVLPETEGRTLADIEAHFSGITSLNERKRQKKLALALKNNDLNLKQGCDRVTVIPNQLFSSKNISDLDGCDNGNSESHMRIVYLPEITDVPEHIRESKAIGLKKSPRPSNDTSRSNPNNSTYF